MPACISVPFSCSPVAHPAPQATPGIPLASPGATATVMVHSQDLLQGHKSVTITHNGTLYRLQATRMGKLILTK